MVEWSSLWSVWSLHLVVLSWFLVLLINKWARIIPFSVSAWSFQFIVPNWFRVVSKPLSDTLRHFLWFWKPWNNFMLSCRPCQMKPMNYFQSSIRHPANSIVLQFQQLTGAMQARLWGYVTWLLLALANRLWCRMRQCMHSANANAARWFWGQCRVTRSFCG